MPGLFQFAGPIIDEKFGDITQDVMEVLAGLRMQDELQAALKQQEAAAALDEVGLWRDRRGNAVAEVQMRVTREIYQHWKDREGPQCWGDPGFRKALLRDNPELRPRTVKAMHRVSMAGLNAKFPKGAILDRHGHRAA